MSSKRDLVEAHSFNRRRLVTAFISGAPGGREVEPVRPGRTLVGGLVLAVLLVAGAGVAGFLKKTLPDDWADSGLVIGEESGSRYLAYDGVLYPVINTTSARLLLDDMDLTFAPEDKIAGQTPGYTIGIPGAPDALPPADQLITTGWTSCVDGSGRLRTRLAQTPGAVDAGPEAVVVEADRTTYVVTGGRRYAVPRSTRDATLRALGLDSQNIRRVPGTWVDLFPLGPGLEPFAVEGAGGPVPAGVAVPGGASRVGTPLLVDGRPFVVARDGLVGLTEFAYAVYRSAGRGAELPELEITASDIADVPASAEQPAPQEWPDTAVTSYTPAPDDPTGSVCALLTEDSQGGAADVTLAEPVRESEAVPGPQDGPRTVDVDGGHGALVQANAGAVLDRGTTYVIDSSGTRYALGGDLESVLRRLGYADAPVTDVPLKWVDLFDDGPELSPDAANDPVGSR